MSLLLSSQYTEPISAAQLLGEPEPDKQELAAQRVAEAEKKLAKLQAGRKK